ncbi:MAG TPA: hypothetical protein VMU32_00655 [Solirubrobacteraceae bacterium]|nr:hypothetical protein [Solirubrobacteraceae bacterium]
MSSEPQGTAYIAGRAIMLQLLQPPEDHPEWWTPAELREQITDLDPAIVDAELARLAELGAVVVDGGRLKASACARCLDALGLIGV